VEGPQPKDFHKRKRRKRREDKTLVLVSQHKVCYALSTRAEKTTNLELYTDAMLTCDLPRHRLRRGDIVKLVERHVAPDGTEGYSIEVFNAVGDTIAVTAVSASSLEALRQDEILCARPL
jgi:hypothetical protein